jgi:hypothetical protein
MLFPVKRRFDPRFADRYKFNASAGLTDRPGPAHW